METEDVSKQYTPLLQARLELTDPDEQEKVETALKIMADADPSIRVEVDSETGGWLLSAVGEVQLDVLWKRLQTEHQCQVKLGAPKVDIMSAFKKRLKLLQIFSSK